MSSQCSSGTEIDWALVFTTLGMVHHAADLAGEQAGFVTDGKAHSVAPDDERKITAAARPSFQARELPAVSFAAYILSLSILVLLIVAAVYEAQALPGYTMFTVNPFDQYGQF